MTNMDIEAFWSLIEDARQKSNLNIEAQLKALFETLTQLSPENIQEFDRLLWTMMLRAYRADLWEAASLVSWGVSDDGFHEFRGWLITQGQAIYEKALDDPENLVEIIGTEGDFVIFDDRILSVVREAYERKTGQEIPESGYRGKAELDRRLIPHNERPAKYPHIMAKLRNNRD